MRAAGAWLGAEAGVLLLFSRAAPQVMLWE